MLTFLVTFFSIGSSALNVSNKKINYKNYLESDFCLFSILQLYLFPASIFLFLTISVKGLELMTSQMIKIHGPFLLTIFLILFIILSFFGSFQTNIIQFLQQKYVKKCSSSIRCRDSNPRPPEHQSPSIPKHYKRSLKQSQRECSIFTKYVCRKQAMEPRTDPIKILQRKFMLRYF